MRFRTGLVVGSILLGVLVLLGASVLPDARPIGHFSVASVDSNGHPANWTPITFSKIDTETSYRLVARPVRGDTTTVVEATSDGGASGLVRRKRIDPAQHPILTWQWKVNTVLDRGDATDKDGDDYPARLYLLFDYDPSNLGFFDRVKYRALETLGYDQIPTRALTYIWANRVEQGTILDNPYTDWVQMIPVESGPDRVGTWIRETRNVAADYREAFGEEPPPIGGIAIMTDTDDTGASATAYYGDITARPLPASERDSLARPTSPD
ncbi:MAG: hypothetical protein BRD33_03690 [Bacteroidetes bacterium QH_6_63_17]|nr:MAG: hypothetical protein BRD33_03690 [Bacteroidetes bacterium QH_6_63_17]